MNTITEHSREILSRVFGYNEFRPHQERAVQGLLDGNDVFALMPTGGGKSLCYQLPAVMGDGCVVVVSPLIALMKDQVDAARSNGIRAACVNSAQPFEVRRDAARAYRAGELDLLYLAPERLATDGFFDKLRHCPSGQPAAFAIDEAHCLSEWGHDFRPDYLVLANLRPAFPGVPIGAFTATATSRVADDITTRLGLHDPVQVRASFDRANLFYEIRAKQDTDTQVVEFLRERPGQSGIIYRTSRKSVESTAALLRRNGIEARAYHAGMEAHERSTAQEAFIRDDCPIIVATIAFGMGIDKPDVRFVVHGDLPKNLESYYQETGRAGRDGEPSHCLLLYSAADGVRQRHFIQQIEDDAERERTLGLLREMERFAAVPACRRRGVLRYFGEEYHLDNCGGCDVCGGSYKSTDATDDARLLLAAFRETGERFGAVHVCDVLTGSNTSRIREREHDRLHCYGSGRAHPKAYWRRLADTLVAKEFLTLGDDTYAVPSITPAGHRLAGGDARVELLEDLRIEPARATNRSNEEPCHDELFGILRALRKDLADDAQVPPYVIFGDRTLRAMAARLPDSESTLASLPGFGQTKIARYGNTFLAAIRRFTQQNPDARPMAAAPTRPVKRTRTDTLQTTLSMLRAGMSVSDIARERGLAEGTIGEHFARLIEDGEQLNWRPYIPEDTETRIRALFDLHGTSALKPVIEAGEGTITYPQAKILRTVLEVGDSPAAETAQPTREAPAGESVPNQ
jgi:ATP-dependent DNA helicase RecQ